MIGKIPEIFKGRNRTYSFEFFPPKTEVGKLKLMETVKVLKDLKPSFLSVTYGAGGSTKSMTMEIVSELQERFDIPTMHHLTCGGHTKDELEAIIEEMRKRNICNILALRGDPPSGASQWEPVSGGMEYAYQLCRLVKAHDNFFGIGAAGFPEGHINCPDEETDIRYLKVKIDSGADFVITQLFFDNRDYFEYVARARKMGITKRIIPGILPIVNYRKLLEFCERCGAVIPQRVHDIFKPLERDDDATYKEGIKFVVKQCEDLLNRGAPGLHFFTLNKVNPTREILYALSR